MKQVNCEVKGCVNHGKYARYCGHFTATVKEVKPIAKVSEPLKEDLKEYKKVRDQFLKENPFCEAGLKGCGVKATEVHHKRGRGKNLVNVETFLAACHSCHKIIEENPAFAKANGLSLSRLTNSKI